MNFKSIELSIPEAKENITKFKPKMIKTDRQKKNNFFIFGKTSKQSDFQNTKNLKLSKRQSNNDNSPRDIKFNGPEAEIKRPKSSYIIRKKVWIDNRNKTKTSTSKNLISVKNK